MSNVDLSKLITPTDKAEIAKADQLTRIKARRDLEISTGRVDLNGVAIATDDLSQQRIMGAVVASMLDPNYSVQWKTPNGFVTLNVTALTAAATAVRAHVQTCFDREAELIAAVAANEAYDLDAGWPSSVA